MSLNDKLIADLKSSMKNGNKIAVETIRIVRASLKNAEISKGENLTEEEVISVLQSEAKKRKEAITEYKKADRQDLVEAEQNELNVIEEYLPRQLNENEINEKIDELFTRINPSSMKEIGKVMGPLMKELKGKADGRLVQQLVKIKFESIE
ncbi:MAG: GatB/YqeY domain-containing protein [Calditrichia bacterium]|nr:GatB/YqeY domain-containing protein [Calditrichia bacterium]